MKPVLVLLNVMMLLALMGCTGELQSESSKKIDLTEQVKNIPQDDYEKPLTREWLKEKYNYTDEELDDYYVDEMIRSKQFIRGLEHIKKQ